MSSSNPYCVFVSCGGKDTRTNFTDHLFHALRTKNIPVFGQSLTPELLRAIEGSQIFIVVFSNNYASSSLCLQELEYILECVNNLNGKCVLPVFYDVEPSEVRNQSGSYGEAFAKHEYRHGYDKVQQWREALGKVVDLPGWVLQNKVIEKIVEEIVEEIINLLDLGSTVPKDVVGMDSRIEEQEKPLLPNDDVVGTDSSIDKLGKFLLPNDDDVVGMDSRIGKQEKFLLPNYDVVGMDSRIEEKEKFSLPNDDVVGMDSLIEKQEKFLLLNDDVVGMDSRIEKQEKFLLPNDVVGMDSQIEKQDEFLLPNDDVVGMDSHIEKQDEFLLPNDDVVGMDSRIEEQEKFLLPNDVVGMDSRIEELEKCLLLDSVDDVRVVGIYGKGGVGKTTLARALYRKISHQFDACCFINDVSKIYDATNLMQHRLWLLRVLLVFDNVDHMKQLEKLAVNLESLVAGSRIIIVCRDAHILKEYGVNMIYKVPLLNQANSLQLLCQILPKHDHVISNHVELVHNILSYANGLPLAIKVLGSLLSREDISISEGKGALPRLLGSFDGLDMMEKETFLHIACFFNGREKDYVKNVLKCCDFSVEKGLTFLIEKSFISITDENKIEMHDLLEKLGKQIVHEHSGKWSRLWLHEQFYNVVLENMENNVEAVVLYGSESEKGILKAETLSKMNHLRLLILKEVKFSGSLSYLSKTLRYVEWDEYPFLYLPPSFQSNELVELILVDSSIKQLWIDTKDLPSLRTLDLSYSENLTKMPYFGEFPNLKRLNLEGCIKLVQIDPSIGLLRELVFLNLKHCENLVCIPNEVSGLTSLKYLNLCGCSKAFDNLNAREDFARCLLPSLPSFSCLSELDVGFCGLSQIPDALGCLTFLKRLNLRGNNFVTLPGLRDLSKLEYLNLEHCKQLTSLPELPSLAAIKQDKHKGAAMLIFNCPELGESEQCSNMILLWTMHFIQANQYSSASFRQIDIVIPGREIPKWFNNRRMDRSISIDPYPFVYDKNIIGIACCAIFSVEPFDPSTTRYEWGPVIRLCFKSSSAANSNYVVIPVTLFRYLISAKSNHMWLIYFDREHFISFLSSKDNTLCELDHIKMEVSVANGQGLLLEVKSCGYRWVFKQHQHPFGSHNNDELLKEESHKL